eukprot:scaffold21586_cov28-Prasinocladus_malaysianus.AAC.1
MQSLRAADMIMAQSWYIICQSVITYRWNVKYWGLVDRATVRIRLGRRLELIYATDVTQPTVCDTLVDRLQPNSSADSSRADAAATM